MELQTVSLIPEKEDVLYSRATKYLGQITDKTELARKFIDTIPLYYDEAQNFWVWDLKKYHWVKLDELDVLSWINDVAVCNVINSKERGEILQALKLEGRRNKPAELSKNTVQFEKELLDIMTGDRTQATPKTFAVHPLPYKLGSYCDTPTIDALFSSWVKAEDVPKLYEIIAFCMIPDYFVERIICLHGSGSNGKSVYRTLVRKVIGETNCCSTSLERLQSSRFEVGRLYKKLVCEMGETNLTKFEGTELIKRLVSGKDLVTGENKNKPSWDFLNYAKLLISTNTLPPTDDKTDGFYRKWLIIDFPNRFEGEVDILATIPEQEFQNLCMKCIDIAYNLMKKKGFTNEGTIDQRRERYEERSNPFDKFWKLFVDDSNQNADIPVWEFDKRLNEWLKENKLRTLSDVSISKYLKNKGILQVRIWKDWQKDGFPVKKQLRCWGGVAWQ